jgi:hypothetical protein
MRVFKKTTSKVDRRRRPLKKDRFETPLSIHCNNKSRIPGRVHPENLKISS